MSTLKKYYKWKIGKLKIDIQLREVSIMYSPNASTTGFLEACKTLDEEELHNAQKKYTFLNYKGTMKGVSKEDIEHAKATPISTFLKVNAMNKTVCLFHTDKTASMHIYQNNRYYCFGCQEKGSVADIVMKLYGLNFTQAINRLLGK